MQKKILIFFILLMLANCSITSAFTLSEEEIQTDKIIDPNIDDSIGFIEWQKKYNSGYWDSGNCIQPTSDGGYICVGCAYGYDVLLIKIDKDGNKQWESRFSYTHPDYGWFVIQTEDNGYLILAETRYNEGGAHVWLIKTDENGAMEWERFIRHKVQTACRCIQPTSDGGYILAGYDAPSAWLWSYDAWLLKIDSEGFEQWNRTYERPYYNWAFYVIQTSDGGYAMTGLACQNTEDYSDMFLTKTDANGIVQWSKTYGDKEPAELGKCVEQTSDGGYIVTGIAYEPAGNILVKTDGEGNALWTSSYGGNCVEQTSDGGYILTGQKMRITGFYDLSITKINSNGKKEWEKLYGRLFYDDEGNFVHQTTDGGFIVIGSNTSKAGILGPIVGQDIWIIKTHEKPFGGNKDLNSLEILGSRRPLIEYLKTILTKKPFFGLLSLLSKF